MPKQDIYKTKAWKKTRRYYALSKNCICERCGRPVYVDGVSIYLPKEQRLSYIVHHKKYLTDANYTDDAIAYDTDNLELLCIDCHNTEHKAQPTKKGLMFDEQGQLVQTKVIKRRYDV